MVSRKLKDMINKFSDLDEFDENQIPGLRLYQDLNIYGDDVDEFFEKYQEQFDVTIPDFNFSDYFPGEGWSFGSIIRFFIGDDRKFKELTIADLQEGIDNQVLKL